MASISLSSAIVAVSSITQKPAKFTFPVKFPLKFNIENLNTNFSESTSVVSSSNITGNLKNIIPIKSNAIVASSNINGQIKNKLGLVVPIVNIMSDMGTPSVLNNLQITCLEGTTNLIPGASKNSYPSYGNTHGTYNTNQYNNGVYFFIGAITSVEDNIVTYVPTHGLRTYDVVRPKTSGGGLVANTNYFIKAISTTQFTIHAYNSSQDGSLGLSVHDSVINDVRVNINNDNLDFPTMWWGAPHLPNSGLVKEIIPNGFSLDGSVSHDCIRLHSDFRTDGIVDGMAYGVTPSIAGGNTYTFSFYHRAITSSSIGKSVRFQVYNNGVYPIYNTFILSSAWQRYSFTAKFPNTSVASMYWFGPAGEVFDIAEIQCEQKDHATPFFADDTRTEGRVLGTTNLTGTTKLNMAILSPLLSTIDMDADDNFKLLLLGNTVSSLGINGKLILQSLINAGLTLNSKINSAISIKVLIVPSTINATGTITGIPTAIFKLVTNIIANTSIASNSVSQIDLDANLTSESNVNGNLINLIESDLVSSSNINLPQTFSFPWEFPFVINDKVTSVVALNSNVSSATSITNNSINQLLVVNLQATSNIAAQITNSYNLKSNVIVLGSIVANTTEKSNITSNITTTSSIFSTITATYNESASITDNTVINGIIENWISSSSDLIVNALISGVFLNLINCNVNAITEIKLPVVFSFPLAFPLEFRNKILKLVALYSESIIVNSEINADISRMLNSDIQSNTIITGIMKNELALNAKVISNFNTNATTNNLNFLNANIHCNSNISSLVANNIKIIGNEVARSDLNGIVSNNISIAGKVVISSSIQAIAIKIHSISVIFIKDINSTSEAKFNNLINTKFINSLSTITLQSNINSNGIMQSNQEIEGFLNCNETFKTQYSSQSEEISMVKNLNEVVVFNSNIDDIQVLNLSTPNQVKLIDVLINTKI